MTIQQDVLNMFNDKASLEFNNKGEEVLLDFDSDLFQMPGDDLHYVLGEYERIFKVDLSDVQWNYYFPWHSIPRLKRWFGKINREEVEATRTPLTIRMFAESAEAGKWLFD